MDKLAKGRRIGLLNKIRESTDFSGKLTEKFSPEFGELMTKLREIDEDVREIAADLDGVTLNSLIKAAQSNLNRREFITSVIYLGRFHERIELIVKKFGELQGDLSKAHRKFLFNDDLDPDQKEFLLNKLPEKFKNKKPVKKSANQELESLIKEAGLGDIWHNLWNDRGRALKQWEKRLPQFVKQLRKETERMINRSEVLMQTLNTTLKTLASQRANRQLESYIKTALDFTKKYNQYDSYFSEFYHNEVAKLIELQKAEETSAVQETTPNAEVSVPQQAPSVQQTSPAQQASSVKSPAVAPRQVPVQHPDAPSQPAGNLNLNEILNTETPSAPPGINPEAVAKMRDLEEKWNAQQPETAKSAPNSSKTPPTGPAQPSKKAPVTGPERSSTALSRRQSTDMIPANTVPINTVPLGYSVDLTDLEPSQPAEYSVDLTSLENPDSKLPFAETQPVPASIPIQTRKMESEIPATRLSDSKLQNPVIPKPAPIPREMQEAMKRETPTEAPSPPTVRSASVNDFINDLSKSTESPLVLANKIIRFANTLEDEATSKRLLTIAKSIISKF